MARTRAAPLRRRLCRDRGKNILLRNSAPLRQPSAAMTFSTACARLRASYAKMKSISSPSTTRPSAFSGRAIKTGLLATAPGGSSGASAPMQSGPGKAAYAPASCWCPGEDSNLHGFHHWYLKPARLPIPPPGPGALNRGWVSGLSINALLPCGAAAGTRCAPPLSNP